MLQSLPESLPCKKKRDGKLCGCQSFLASDSNDKVCSYCEHRQNLRRKRSRTPALCSGIASSTALNEPDVLSSAIDDQKRNSDFQEYPDLNVDFV